MRELMFKIMNFNILIIIFVTIFQDMFIFGFNNREHTGGLSKSLRPEGFNKVFKNNLNYVV